jgi:hypothetical protein
MWRRFLTIGIALAVAGCCKPISPTAEEVQKWVRQSLPTGSSEDQVKAFCTQRGFNNYTRMDSDVTEPNRHWGQASRRVGGCESDKPVVIIDVYYDGDLRMQSINVRGASM